MKPTLTSEDFNRAAESLGVPEAAIRAVFEVEAPRGGFLPDGQVTILFERHKFSEYTGGKFDKSAPDVSNPDPGGYGAEGQHQHDRLAKAVALDRDAALRATSWGKPQILGANYRAAGFPSLQSFINAMHHSEGAQLDAFVSFIKNDRGGRTWQSLKDGVNTGKWGPFAANYNGANYKRYSYDTKLAAAFDKYTR